MSNNNFNVYFKLFEKNKEEGSSTKAALIQHEDVNKHEKLNMIEKLSQDQKNNLLKLSDN